MRKNDIARAFPLDVAVALALLTRLPLPRLPNAAFAQQARAVWAFPVVGLIVGLLACIVGLCALAAGLPAAVAAGLLIATQIVVTGAMHEDGLADTCDGLWGGWTPQRRLEIMKDSVIGTYGVLALVLSVGIRWAAVTALLILAPWSVVAAAALSRGLLAMLMAALPHARSDGLSHRVGAPSRGPVAISLLLGLTIGWAATGPISVGALLAAAAVVFLLAVLARARIGGQTGDILGAAQQLGEIAVLLTLLAAA